MGDKLLGIYQKVRKKYGNIGVYRLIVKSKLSEDAVKKLPDTEDNLNMIKAFTDELGLAVTAEMVKKRRGLLRMLLRRS